MRTIKINTSDVNINGTSLVGYVTTTYDKLVEALGEPDYYMDKSNAHWALQAPDGTVATVYDYKLSSAPTYEYDWHVGGTGSKSLLLVEFMLGVKPQTYNERWNKLAA